MRPLPMTRFSIRTNSRALRTSCQCTHNSAQTASYKELLERTLPLSTTELQKQVEENKTPLNSSFLSWLATEQETADSVRQRDLDRLGGQLMAIRCGLLPAEQDEVGSRRLAEQDSDETETSTLPSNTTHELAASEWNAKDEMVLLEQADRLSEQVEERRKESLAAVAGRLELDERSSARFQKRLAAADSANRIARALVDIPDREVRKSCLPDAFTPPAESSTNPSKAADGTPEDLIHTTPLQLLQAVKSTIKLMNLPGKAEEFKQLSGPEAAGCSTEELITRLECLQEDVMAYWEQQQNV